MELTHSGPVALGKRPSKPRSRGVVPVRSEGALHGGLEPSHTVQSDRVERFNDRTRESRYCLGWLGADRTRESRYCLGDMSTLEVGEVGKRRLWPHRH